MPFTMPFSLHELLALKAALKAKLDELERLTALTRSPFAIVRFKIKPQKRKPVQTLSAFSAPKKRMYGKR